MARLRKIQIRVEPKLLKDLEKALASRGTDVESFLRLQILAAARTQAKSMMGLQDRMPYGKYSGAVIEDIVRGDPQYIAFLYSQHSAKFAQDVLDLMDKLVGDFYSGGQSAE